MRPPGQSYLLGPFRQVAKIWPWKDRRSPRTLWLPVPERTPVHLLVVHQIFRHPFLVANTERKRGFRHRIGVFQEVTLLKEDAPRGRQRRTHETWRTIGQRP